MYLEFFGLKEKPFSLTPDPKFFFQSETHKTNLEQAVYGIRQREGFIVVTGAIGTGKTTLCRAIHEKMDRKVHTAVVLNPFLSEEELLESILLEFGVLQKGGQRPSKKEMLDRLNEFLLNTLKEGENALLIIDEAQNLPMPALEQIRIVSNLETDKEKLLQIILVGQLGLLRLLKSPELQQLDQRISVKCQINPLKKEEVQRYIEYRLTVAGSSGGIAFAPEALDLIYEYSLGIPRVINLICDRSLLGAYTLKTTNVNKALVQKAVEQLKLEKPGVTKRKVADLTTSAASGMSFSKIRLPFVIGGITVITGALAFLIFDNVRSKTVKTKLERQYSQEARTWQIEKARMDEQLASLEERVEAVSARSSVTGSLAVPEDLKDSFTIFLGTFKDKDSAIQKSTNLRSLGYRVYLISLNGTLPGKQYHLVLGSFKERKEAEDVLVKLHERSELSEARVVPFSETLTVN
ncbi:MAG TPA: AAA family ATPase [Candidatus Hypogeohydataceae bacterium YC41]